LALFQLQGCIVSNRMERWWWIFIR